ncbi:hypothetical protein [Streptomyces sp. SAI-090]|jgi:hypothetical protein|uniref:hypothetical protein n=1 Tax=Streptomyces sp. SAI-090 TaxID=2940545 RepID=UPI0024769A88|nr:hypothetical protein [Streptomyces sp. SAI-090]MDH6522445.1 hypothetical protein [Streptomyces sp. SAI-090]
MPILATSVTTAEELLALAVARPFRAPYLPQVIDWICRSAEAECEHAGPGLQAGLAEEVVRRLDAYAASTGPGRNELASRLEDARHAQAVVRAEHYRALAIGHAGPTHGQRQPLTGADLRRLAVTAGKAKVLHGEQDTVVILGGAAGSMVFHPISDQETQRLTQSLREGTSAARELAGDIQRMLARHVRTVGGNESADSGVTVGAHGPEVSVSWQAPAGLPESGQRPGPWEEGGVRSLCKALLIHYGYKPAAAQGGALTISSEIV